MTPYLSTSLTVSGVPGSGKMMEINQSKEQYFLFRKIEIKNQKLSPGKNGTGIKTETESL